ncbi:MULTISPECIES: ATP-binding protein [unclassified Maridesulfovibrio]|uniref:ATP-binding protein n=1 Tax=unclassified Maridesulfovibrio TaxID=2794999 RepID=UPI003B414F22
MTIELSHDDLLSLLQELRKQPNETEWLEFKHNYANQNSLGEYISALANSAALSGKVCAYLVWGIDDKSHDILGTNFNPNKTKIGNEELESWLLRSLAPKINFKFYSFEVDNLKVVLLEIGAAFRHPLQFKGTEFIRVGSYKKRLKDFPEKERELWRIFDNTPFEKEIAAENITADDVIKLLDYPAYFDLLSAPLPEGRNGILESLAADEMIVATDSGKWSITNLGAVLFAKKLASFNTLRRKGVRVIQYDGDSRISTIKEQEGSKGYASGFEGLIEFITNMLPSNEIIGKALRKNVPVFPELAIRELIANAIIHQDFHATGTGPMVEIFSDRMEITNPGIPLVNTQRFLDSPPKSRNESLASFMRRVGICEERGSGIDKVVFQTEIYQLPAPLFEITDEHLRVVLFSYKEFKDMDKDDRIRACYLHACLHYVNRKPMTNASLRERFGIESKNSAMVSRLIKEALETGLIKYHESTAGNRGRKYIPCWA